MVQRVDVSNLQEFECQLRRLEVTKTKKDSSKRSATIKLKASDGAPTKHYMIEEEVPKSCIVVPTDEFWRI